MTSKRPDPQEVEERAETSGSVIFQPAAFISSTRQKTPWFMAEFAKVSPQRITAWFVHGRNELKNQKKSSICARSVIEQNVLKPIHSSLSYSMRPCNWEKITVDGKKTHVFHKLTSIDKNVMIGHSEAVLLAPSDLAHLY
ncbi:unnamed protein product [Caenorhabditis nigoni]